MRIQPVIKGEGRILPLRKGNSPEGYKYQEVQDTGLLVTLELIDGVSVILSDDVLASFGYYYRNSKSLMGIEYSKKSD
jgi:hypothetical protein